MAIKCLSWTFIQSWQKLGPAVYMIKLFLPCEPGMWCWVVITFEQWNVARVLKPLQFIKSVLIMPGYTFYPPHVNFGTSPQPCGTSDTAVVLQQLHWALGWKWNSFSLGSENNWEAEVFLPLHPHAKAGMKGRSCVLVHKSKISMSFIWLWTSSISYVSAHEVTGLAK